MHPATEKLPPDFHSPPPPHPANYPGSASAVSPLPVFPQCLARAGSPLINDTAVEEYRGINQRALAVRRGAELGEISGPLWRCGGVSAPSLQLWPAV